MKQPRQVEDDGFVAARVDSVQAVTPNAERWRELRDKLPRLFSDQPQEVHVVVLTAESGRRLPIWVGSFEAQALRLHLDGLKTERPLTLRSNA